ncbi:MAG: hypothetical protein QOD75_2578 [Blastocatellia bacterium]|jgi:hypothetical protein|nr:hypothetical protein [Blastocatellia bacterium]
MENTATASWRRQAVVGGWDGHLQKIQYRFQLRFATSSPAPVPVSVEPAVKNSGINARNSGTLDVND